MRWFLSTLISLAVTVWATADGGVPVDSRIVDGRRLTLLMQPAPPTVGEVRCTVLGADHVPLRLEVLGVDGRSDTSFRIEPGRPGNHAELQLAREGPASFRVLRDGDDAPMLAVEVTVLPAPAAWFTRMPWLLWWTPVAGVLALRAFRRRGRVHSETDHDALPSE